MSLFIAIGTNAIGERNYSCDIGQWELPLRKVENKHDQYSVISLKPLPNLNEILSNLYPTEPKFSNYGQIKALSLFVNHDMAVTKLCIHTTSDTSFPLCNILPNGVVLGRKGFPTAVYEAATTVKANAFIYTLQLDDNSLSVGCSSRLSDLEGTLHITTSLPIDDSHTSIKFSENSTEEPLNTKQLLDRFGAPLPASLPTPNIHLNTLTHYESGGGWADVTVSNGYKPNGILPYSMQGGLGIDWVDDELSYLRVSLDARKNILHRDGAGKVIRTERIADKPPNVEGLLKDTGLDELSGLLPQPLREAELHHLLAEFDKDEGNILLEGSGKLFDTVADLSLRYRWQPSPSIEFSSHLSGQYNFVSLRELINTINGHSDASSLLNYLPLASVPVALKELIFNTTPLSFYVGVRIGSEASWADLGLGVELFIQGGSFSGGSFSFEYYSPQDATKTITLGDALQGGLLPDVLSKQINELTSAQADQPSQLIDKLLNTSLELLELTVAIEKANGGVQVETQLNAEFTLLEQPMAISLDVSFGGSQQAGAELSIGNLDAEGLAITDLVDYFGINLGATRDQLPLTKIGLRGLIVDTRTPSFTISANAYNGFSPTDTFKPYNVLTELDLRKSAGGFNISALVDTSEQPLTLTALAKDLQLDDVADLVSQIGDLQLDRTSIEVGTEPKSLTFGCAASITLESFLKKMANVDSLPEGLPTGLLLDYFTLSLNKNNIAIAASIDLVSDTKETGFALTNETKLVLGSLAINLEKTPQTLSVDLSISGLPKSELIPDIFCNSYQFNFGYSKETATGHSWKLSGNVDAILFESRKVALAVSSQKEGNTYAVNFKAKTEPVGPTSPFFDIVVAEQKLLEVDPRYIELSVISSDASSIWTLQVQSNLRLFAPYQQEAVFSLDNGCLFFRHETKAETRLEFTADNAKWVLPSLHYTEKAIKKGVNGEEISEEIINKQLTLGVNFNKLLFTKENKQWTVGGTANLILNDLPHPLNQLLKEKPELTISVSQKGIRLKESNALKPVTIPDLLKDVEISPDIELPELGASAFQLQEVDLTVAKDAQLSVAFGVALPANLNKAIGIKDKPLFRTWIDGDEDSFVKARIAIGSTGITGQLLNTPFHDQDWIKTITKGETVNVRIDFDGMCSTENEYGWINVEMPKIGFDARSGSFMASGGFEICKDPGLKLPLKPIKALLRLLDLENIAEQLPSGIPIKSRDLSGAELGRFCKEIELEIPDELQEILNFIDTQRNKLPNRFQDYLRINLPEKVDFGLAITADAGISFELEVVGEPLQLLMPTPMQMMGTRLQRLVFGTMFGGTMLKLETTAEFDAFDYLTLAGSFLLLDNQQLKDILPTRQELQRTFILDDFVMLIIIATAVPIPIPLFYKRLEVIHHGLEGFRLHTNISFPKPTFSISEVLKSVGEISKFFKEETYYLPAQHPITLDPQNNSIKPIDNESMNLTFSAGPLYFSLPKFIKGSQGELITLGTKETYKLFDALNLTRIFLNGSKHLFTNEDIGYFVRTLPLEKRITSTDVELFETLSFGIHWVFSTPEEFVAAAKNNELTFLGNKPAFVADNMLKALRSTNLPAKAGQTAKKLTVTDKGLVSFLRGDFSIANVMAVTASGGVVVTKGQFVTALNFAGHLGAYPNELIAFSLKGIIHVDKTNEALLLQGDSSLSLMGINILRGGFHLQQAGDTSKLAIWSELGQQNTAIWMKARLAGVLSNNRFYLGGDAELHFGILKANGRASIKIESQKQEFLLQANAEIDFNDTLLGTVKFRGLFKEHTIHLPKAPVQIKLKNFEVNVTNRPIPKGTINSELFALKEQLEGELQELRAISRELQRTSAELKNVISELKKVKQKLETAQQNLLAHGITDKNRNAINKLESKVNEITHSLTLSTYIQKKVDTAKARKTALDNEKNNIDAEYNYLKGEEGKLDAILRKMDEFAKAWMNTPFDTCENKELKPFLTQVGISSQTIRDLAYRAWFRRRGLDLARMTREYDAILKEVKSIGWGRKSNENRNRYRNIIPRVDEAIRLSDNAVKESKELTHDCNDLLKEALGLALIHKIDEKVNNVRDIYLDDQNKQPDENLPSINELEYTNNETYIHLKANITVSLAGHEFDLFDVTFTKNEFRHIEDLPKLITEHVLANLIEIIADKFSIFELISFLNQVVKLATSQPTEQKVSHESPLSETKLLESSVGLSAEEATITDTARRDMLAGPTSATYSHMRQHSELFFQGTDGYLHFYYVENSQWKENKDSFKIATIMGPISSVYSPKLGRSEVFFQGVDGFLHHYFVNAGGGWENDSKAFMGAKVAGAMSAIYSTSRQHSELFLRGTDGYLYFFYFSDNRWQFDYRSFQKTKVKGAISAVYSSIRQHSEVFFHGEDDLLHYYYFEGGQWKHDANSFKANKVTGSISAIYSPINHRSEVFFRGENELLKHYFVNTAGMWEDGSQGFGKAKVANSLSAIYSPSRQHSELFIQGTDGYLYHVYFRENRWNFESESFKSTKVIGSITSVHSVHRQHIEVYFQGADGLLHYYFMNINHRWEAGHSGFAGFKGIKKARRISQLNEINA